MDQWQKLHNDREEVELFFSARDLPNLALINNSNPQLFVYLQEGKYGYEQLIGQTEVRKNTLNPDWKASVKLEFVFEVVQNLRILIKDNHGGQLDDKDIIGTVKTTVSQIMGSKNQIFIVNLKQNNIERGKLIIKGDKRMEIGEKNPLIYWQWYGKKIKNMNGWFGRPDPFLRFLKFHHNQYWLLVYETEFVKNNENPIWKGFEIPLDKLHGGNPLQPFKIELWDNESNGKHQLVGEILIKIDQIINQKKLGFEVKTRNEEFGGYIGIKSMSKPSLIDYLKGGEQINLSIAIDFTSSNGKITNHHSLHYYNPQSLNQYQNALLQVSEILLHYDYDKKVALYGFGGVPRFLISKGSLPLTSHCFPLNGKINEPEVLGLPGIMETYTQVLNQIDFDGPTYFRKVLKNAIRIAEKNKNKDIYNVLMILTDGQVDDMEKSIKYLKKAALLPLSVIIVGVGSADFSMMKRLNGSEGDFNGVARELVQFVQFEEFKSNFGDLANKLLAKLPDQLIYYKQLIGRDPNPSKKTDISKF